MNVSLQLALARARLVARSDFRRAVSILRAARIKLESCIAIVARFVGAAALVSVAACGGGDERTYPTSCFQTHTRAECATSVPCVGVTGLLCQ